MPGLELWDFRLSVHPEYGRIPRATNTPINRRRSSLAIRPWLSGCVLNFTRMVAAPSASDSMPTMSSGARTRGPHTGSFSIDTRPP